MLVTGYEFASFAIWSSYRKRYFINDVPRNDAFCEILVATIDKFMHAVNAGSWDKWGSEIDGSKATTEALRRLYPRDRGTIANLPEEAQKWADELAMVKGEIKSLSETESTLENQLRLALGENSYGLLQDGTGYSLREVRRAGYTVEPTSYRQLRKIKSIPKGLLK